jgi:hypothetical protein
VHLPLIVYLLLTLYPALATGQEIITPQQCLECHEGVVGLPEFRQSVHGQLICTSCHTGIVDLESHSQGETSVQPAQCARCHKPEAAAHYGSIHMLSDIGCPDCHTQIHTQQPWQGNKQVVVETCETCHPAEAYAQSVHGRAVEAGNEDSAACHDCHNLHEIREIAPETEEYEIFQVRICMQCHADEEMMRRNDVYPLAVETYMDSYHGKSYRLGSPKQIAECADCHTAHSVLPPGDPASSIHPAHVVETCGQCHQGIGIEFTKFHVHGTYHDRQRYPLMFWTYVLMTGLLVSVFSIFWIHTVLWMFRGFVENRRKEKALADGHAEPIPGGHLQYRRFRGMHIFLHLTVIVSFLGLSLTGLPLKFAEMEWARAMMSFYGGVQMAGVIHRLCAGLTFFYFFVALGMSVHFLFIRRDVPGNWVQRFFGPDSLMFNGKDWRDIQEMIRWFLFRGEKPRFERWTYWE